MARDLESPNYYGIEDTKNINHFHVYRLGYLISLSSFLWGYCMAVFNVCLTQSSIGAVVNTFKDMDTNDQQLLAALALAGGLFASFWADKPTEKYGRKRCLIANNILFIAGAFISGAATSVPMLLVGRTILGIACGVVTVAAPVLLTEISPDEVRGKITMMHQLQVTIGILISALIGYVLVTYSSIGWRYANYFIAIPAIVQVLFCKIIPESPRWLLAQGKAVEAELVWKSLNPHDPDPVIPQDKQNEEGSWGLLLSYKRPVLISCCLIFFQAMTGINSVIFYSSNIFELAGVDQAILATVIVNLVNVMMTIVSGVLVDRYGRKILILCGTSAQCIGLILLGVFLLALNEYTKTQGLLAVVCVVFYVAAFAIGLGAVAW